MPIWLNSVEPRYACDRFTQQATAPEPGLQPPNNNKQIDIENPSNLPPVGKIAVIKEPFIAASIITPSEFIGNIMKLCLERRGIFINTNYLDGSRVDMHFKLPLAEVIFDFYDKLKSCSSGYASFDYEYDSYKEAKLVKLDILIV